MIFISGSGWLTTPTWAGHLTLLTSFLLFLFVTPVAPIWTSSSASTSQWSQSFWSAWHFRWEFRRKQNSSWVSLSSLCHDCSPYKPTQWTRNSGLPLHPQEGARFKSTLNTEGVVDSFINRNRKKNLAPKTSHEFKSFMLPSLISILLLFF